MNQTYSWKERFLESFLNVSKNNTKSIFATNSLSRFKGYKHNLLSKSICIMFFTGHIICAQTQTHCTSLLMIISCKIFPLISASVYLDSVSSLFWFHADINSVKQQAVTQVFEPLSLMGQTWLLVWLSPGSRCCGHVETKLTKRSAVFPSLTFSIDMMNK